MVEDSAIVALAQGLLRFSFVPLYATAGVLVYFWLFPRLTRLSQGLALLFLAAQVIVIGISQIVEPSSSYDFWLWNLDQEWNIPSTLASTQLALVGAVALLTAWLAASRPVWLRMYFAFSAAVFLVFAYDEYFLLHETMTVWRDLYAIIGVGIAAASLALALATPRPPRRAVVCLLIGLGLAGFGAIFVDAYHVACNGWSYVVLAGECIKVVVLEESLEFLGIWLVLVAMLGLFSRLASGPGPGARRALATWPLIWAVILIQSDAVSEPLDAESAAVRFESDARLHGYRIEKDGSALQAHLYLSTATGDFDGLGYSISLIDQASLAFVAAGDAHAHQRLEFRMAPGFRQMYRQWIEVSIPPDSPSNRAIWIILSLWREHDGEFIREKATASDHQLLSDSQVILDEFVIESDSMPAEISPLAKFDNGFVLEAASFSALVTAGETLNIAFAWRADRPDQSNLIQFLHLRNEDSGVWQTYDQQPLGARLPTRLWYTGLTESEVWQVSLPSELAPGKYAAFTGLYHSRDYERVAARAADGSPYLDARVPLGYLELQK